MVKKKTLIAHIISGGLLICTSAVSMAATNTIGTHQQRITATVTSGTCSVTWPTDVNFSINSADTAVSNGTQIGETISAGNFILTGCPASTAIKYSVSAGATAQGNTYQGLFTDSSGADINSLGYRLSSQENFSSQWNLAGTDMNLGTTDSSGELTVPVYAELIKRGSSTAAIAASGDLNAVVTYTIGYN
ncbi:TPA: type 1 fimbrial protein [Escherichia coli]|nr:type 1 fimbrial protein [Escherichia coli]